MLKKVIGLFTLSLFVLATVLLFKVTEAPITDATVTISDPGIEEKPTQAPSLTPPNTSRLKAQRIDVDKPDWSAIEEQLRSKDSSTRFLVTNKLGKVRRKKSIELLISQLRSEDLAIRLRAAASVEELIGYRIESEALKDRKSAEGISSTFKEWWESNKHKSFNQHRLDQLKKKSKAG